ncbi:MAG TPA: CDP-glycerol glycerophosphotransferase family protein [Jatrophihabitantaceae bacterium]|jgi:CDP-glycerol glycerophosphotransferase|nr:CDP-glycerol glycerophosphotransferase family protein [Jatrophihabitantaceae bacterium]
MFGGKSRQLLRELNMSQHEQELRVEIDVDPAVVPLALWSRSSSTDDWTRHGSFQPTGWRHAAVVDLAEFAPTEEMIAAAAAAAPEPVTPPEPDAEADEAPGVGFESDLDGLSDAGFDETSDGPADGQSERSRDASPDGQFDAAFDAEFDPPSPASRVRDRRTLYVEVDRTFAASESAAADKLRDRDDATFSSAPDGAVRVNYRIQLARAATTDIGLLHPVEVDGATLWAFVTDKGALAIGVNRKPYAFASMQVRYLGMFSGRLRINGRLATGNGDVESLEFMLKGRNYNHRARVPLTIRPDIDRTRREYGHHWYRVNIDVDCARLLEDPGFVDDTYDAWLSVGVVQRATPLEIRVGRPRFHTRYLTRSGGAVLGDRAAVLSPYYTFYAKRAAVQVNIFDAEAYHYLRRAVRTRYLRKHRAGKQVWLVGERSRKAQDNGFYLFKHLRESHPEVDAYYVIEHDSPERVNVEPLGNVVDYRSKEHIRVALQANVVAGSHHAELLFPTRAKQFARSVRAKRVFLQHGVMGAKWTAHLYHKRTGFKTDMFVVSSEREKELIVRDFGFTADEIANTGLARFDSLFAGDVPVQPRQVLIMPTWRWYLQDADAYPKSVYHRRWTSFLNDPRLREMEQRYGLEVLLALHPNNQQFRHLFTDLPVRLIDPGEVEVQRLLKESALLITDYSSVGWDFAFLHKPVLFFQFDRPRLTAPHIDPDEELPGPSPATIDGLFVEFEKLASTGFTMTDEYRVRADRFIDRRDRASSERIFQHATSLRRDRNVVKRVKSHEFTYLLWQRIRRSKRYMPAMKWFFRLAKLLPIDKNLVLFEAGMGKQYADSPRYIYEELVRRGDTRTKVWSYSGNLPAADAHTRVVKRHSPAFYYYLARAGYWISNQNFPYYVTRRSDAVYLQTWHGTPLKRMLHDLGQVHGRDEGYLGRVTTMVKQWSTLLSPSPFATEALRSAFRYKGEILEAGYPRNDLFNSPDRDQIAARVRRRFNIRDDQRVILYAPTFRDDQPSKPGKFAFNLPLDLQQLYDEFGENTFILLRMHIHVDSKIVIPKDLKHVVRDVSNYPEIQELMLASDILITDYSSVFFDYAALRRPIIFYAYDLDHYRDDVRGFYLDFEADVPGEIVTTHDDLIKVLRHLDEVDAPHQERRDEFLRRFGPWDDGGAARRVVDKIFGPEQPPH